MTHSDTTPVVLVHGWGGCFRDTWQKPGIDALLGDIERTVMGVDLLGHGDADKPHDPEAYAQMGQWLLQRLAAHQAPFDAVGFSLGALTVLDALLASPSTFGRVVLAGIGDGVFSKETSGRNSRIVEALEGRSGTEDTFAQMFVQYANQPGNDPVALTAIMKRPARPPLTPEQLGAIDNEVLVVIGDQDFTYPAERLASSFPNGRLVVLKNTDHFATTESFAFIDALLEFLA